MLTEEDTPTTIKKATWVGYQIASDDEAPILEVYSTLPE